MVLGWGIPAGDRTSFGEGEADVSRARIVSSPMERARSAIDRVYSDTKLSPQTTAEGLLELSERIDEYLDMLRSDGVDF